MPVNSNESRYLYRIVSLPRALDLLRSKELHLSLPSAWDDPFETLLRHERSHALFAQCWCKRAVSDAMWKIYSADKRSVRIRTARHTLLSSVTAAARGLPVWLQDVTYKSPTQVRSALLEIVAHLRSRFSVEEAVKALFLKRDAFDFEAEVRLIVHDETVNRVASDKKHLRVCVDVHELIDSIMFDPRVNENEYREAAARLRTAGFSGVIGKSALYRRQSPYIA